MGLLIDGVWHVREPRQMGQDTARPYFALDDARAMLSEGAFRSWVTPTGRPGPTGHDGFAAAAGRYHLYVSYACPWAQRAGIMRALKGLDKIISLSVTHWLRGEQGWSFIPGEGVVADPLFGARYLHEIYTHSDPTYTGRVTLPVLWDKHTQTIVNNESADIVRMFNSAFDGLGATPDDFRPPELRAQIDDWNARIQGDVNEGVYRAGFATTAAMHQAMVDRLFAALDMLDAHLAGSRFLCGAALTEADIRLFPTLLRFDVVYYDLFRCRRKHLSDYKHLWAYTRDLYQWPGIASTVNMGHIRRHYYESMTDLNPAGTVPDDGLPDFDAPADRGRDVSRLLTF